MKKLFTFFTAALMSANLFAAVKIGDIYYEYKAFWEPPSGPITYEMVVTSSPENDRYSGDIVIPTSVEYNADIINVTRIGEDAFYGCVDLTLVTVPNSVKVIEKGAFCGCKGLIAISIPSGVTSIGNGAFAGCNSLISIDVPNSVASIGENAFSSCKSLTAINVATDNPNFCSVDGVLFNKNKSALFGYPGGKQGGYTIPQSVASIGNYAFCGCVGLTSIEIPNSITSIGGHAFYDCVNMISVSIPKSITIITYGAFSHCTSLTSVTIPNSITSIEGGAFGGCTSLPFILIPSSVNRIDSYAFSGCTGLIYVTCEAIIPPTTEFYVFYNVDCSHIPLYVPAESVDAYKAANQWKDFANILPIQSQELTNINAEDVASKLLRDGHVFIHRDGKTYTVTGQEVK